MHCKFQNYFFSPRQLLREVFFSPSVGAKNWGQEKMYIYMHCHTLYQCYIGSSTGLHASTLLPDLVTMCPRATLKKKFVPCPAGG